MLIHTVGLLLLSTVMRQVVEWWRLHRHGMGQTVAMVTTVLGLFLLHTIEVWVWAGVYLWLGAIGMLEEALYFSTGFVPCPPTPGRCGAATVVGPYDDKPRLQTPRTF